MVIHEYLRANRKTVEYLAEKAGCNASTLWRYRHQIRAFQRMPLNVLGICLRQANASNETIRYILGLPTGLSNEK